LISSLRYHRRLADSEYPQDVDAAYTLRAATKLLGTDFAYTSHVVGLHYRVSHGKHQVIDQVQAGSIGGQAPLADRFVAGNSYYLRGWNKYDIDPIGGNRLVHNSIEYRYGPFQAFYDAGLGQRPARHPAAFDRRGLQGIYFFARPGVPREIRARGTHRDDRHDLLMEID
jgi:hypothetical protein